MGQDPPAHRAHYALDQRACDPHHGDERLAHLQRVALFPVPDSERAHPRRLACGRTAMAFRRHVAAGAERVRLRDLRDRFRPFQEEVPADHAARDIPRRAGGAARKAGARGPLRIQRRAALCLPRDHPVRPRAGSLGPRDLETGSTAGDHGHFRRLRGRARGSLSGDGAARAHRVDPCAAHLADDVHRPRKEGLMKTMQTSLAGHPGKLVRSIERRLFLRQGLSLGALALLSGCDLTDDESVQKLLTGMSRWNDAAQAWLFNPNKLAPEFPESAITKPFPFNAFYSVEEVTLVDGKDYKLELEGLIRDKKPWTLPELYSLPQTSQITRHICVEGWSAIGKWSGVRFSDFLARIGADTSARYIGFKCADDYYSSIDMATALHPQTLLTFRFADQVLPPKYGFPMKLRIPTKLGFKNPKHIMSMFVTNEYPGGYWEDQGYNWFSGS